MIIKLGIEPDKPTANGNIYPKEVLETALNDLMKREHVFVQLPFGSGEMHIERICGKVTDRHGLYFEVSPIGPYKDMLDFSQYFVLFPVGLVKMKDNVVENVQLRGFSLSLAPVKDPRTK